MKKLICALTALAVMSMPVTVFAEQTPADGEETNEIELTQLEPSGNTLVTTRISPSYIVTIPKEVNVPFNQVDTDLGSVKLTYARLELNSHVTVTLNASKTLKNKADATNTLNYTIYEGKAASRTDNEFTSVDFTTKDDEQPLTINIKQEDWNSAYAGDYSDELVFTVSYSGTMTPEGVVEQTEPQPELEP